VVEQLVKEHARFEVEKLPPPARAAKHDLDLAWAHSQWEEDTASGRRTCKHATLRQRPKTSETSVGGTRTATSTHSGPKIPPGRPWGPPPTRAELVLPVVPESMHACTHPIVAAIRAGLLVAAESTASAAAAGMPAGTAGTFFILQDQLNRAGKRGSVQFVNAMCGGHWFLNAGLDGAGNTALHFACAYGSDTAVSWLMHLCESRWTELVLRRNAVGQVAADLAKKGTWSHEHLRLVEQAAAAAQAAKAAAALVTASRRNEFLGAVAAGVLDSRWPAIMVLLLLAVLGAAVGGEHRVLVGAAAVASAAAAAAQPWGEGEGDPPPLLRIAAAAPPLLKRGRRLLVIAEAEAEAPAVQDPPRDVCGNAACASVDPPQFVCSGCQATYYCSKECQRTAWRGHKAACRAALAAL
jgi:hypothetical protein